MTILWTATGDNDDAVWDHCDGRKDGPDGALTPLPGPDPHCNSTKPRSEG